jgi:hypothetical protein
MSFKKKHSERLDDYLLSQRGNRYDNQSHLKNAHSKSYITKQETTPTCKQFVLSLFKRFPFLFQK